ncbi:MAG TPA: metallophosphoesterase [Gemmataceae bacterium]|nr:metallophosphoesterase [Gemmataceae bacterium]
MRVLHDWLLTPERVAVHLPTRTAVVADLHLGYDEARRRRGDAVPGESMTELLEPLLRVKRQHAARHLVIAGDLLEEGDCREALAAFLEWIDRNSFDLMAVVPGNHDLGLEETSRKCKRRYKDPSLTLPARTICPQGVMVGGWRIVHGEGLLPDAPVVHGHDHPCLRWLPKSRANRPRFARGRFAPDAIDGPCFLSGPQRLILPAFSKEAAGVNVLSVRRWRALCCHVVAADRVLDLGAVSTLGRRLSAADAIRAAHAAQRSKL